MRRVLSTIGLITLAFLPLSLQADDTSKGVGIYIDQDFFIPGRNEDRDYTMGVAVEVFEEDMEHPGYVFDSIHELFDRGFKLTEMDEEVASSNSYLFGVIVYTPDDLADANPIRDDRPYSSLIYLSKKRVEAAGDLAIGSDLQVGILGLRIAKEVQTAFHQGFRDITGDDEPVDPQGWQHQISDGGEPTLRYRFSVAKAFLQSAPDSLFDWDVAGNSEFSLGYQTNASAGLSMRFGKLSSGFWTLPYDPVNRGNFIPSTSGEESYLWGTFRSRLVGYDVLLQGQFRNSEVTFSGGELKRIVHEAGIGYTHAFKPVQLTFSLNMRTAELAANRDRTHVWGGLIATYRY